MRSNINDIFQVLDSVDNLKEIYELSRSTQSICDKKTSDILHYIEENILTENEYIALMRELKEVREERRIAKNNIEIYKLFEKFNITSLDNDNTNLKEMLKQFVNHPYQYRYYSDGLAEILN